jgi:hypothetical protein
MEGYRLASRRDSYVFQTVGSQRVIEISGFSLVASVKITGTHFG